MTFEPLWSKRLYCTVKMPRLAPYSPSRHQYSFEDWIRKKSSIYDPKAKGNRIPLDLQYHGVALILAKELFLITNPNLKRSKMRNFFTCRSSLNKAHQLVRQAGLDPSKAPYALQELHAFTKCLPEGVSLNFFDDAVPPFLRLGAKIGKTINIFIGYRVEEGVFHAYGINSMSGFFGTDEYCNHCFTGYAYGRKHKCRPRTCTTTPTMADNSL